MKPLLLAKMGSTVSSLQPRRGDFEDWFLDGLGIPKEALLLVRVAEGEPLPAPERVGGAIFTGSPAMISDRPSWSLATEAWLQAFLPFQQPVLGVCYGHQLVAQALGGEAGWNHHGREIGSIEVHLHDAAQSDPLFGELSSPFVAQASHSQSVLRLPPQSTLLAGNGHDPHQAFRWGDRVWGTQFHPEFDGDIAAGYVRDRGEALKAEGLDPQALLQKCRDSPAGDQILKAFARLCFS
ncbi:MAG: glutamine amidotransferase [Planctomycetota bacterium]|nr:MAG: glutamine amidotransferase [Planctomycetota bacterium]